MIHTVTAIVDERLSLPFIGVFNEHRDGTDLDGVRVVGRVFKQTVVRVEKVTRQQEEELARRSAVVQAARHNVDTTITLPAHQT